MEERVQKILARAGYGSRRASEELILAGRVRINGDVAVLGSKADPLKDTITVDNQVIAQEAAPTYIAVNKPTGVLSEVSPDEPRKTVRDLVPVPGHLFIVGRLDLESEGLILLTNDGELANKLTHPRYGHEKEYQVLVGARPDEKQLDAWRHGVVLEDGYRTAPAQVRLDGVAGKGAWLRVILREGRKRQIREMGKLTGLPVLRIQRIRIGSLLLGDLKPGDWRNLKPDEVRALRSNKPSRESVSRDQGRVQRRLPGRTGAPARTGTSIRPAGRTTRSETGRGTANLTGRPERDETRAPYRRPERTSDRDSDRAPSRSYGRGPERDGDRGPARGGYGRSAEQGTDRGPSRGYSRGPEREGERGPARGYGRTSDRDSDRGPSRGPSRGPDRDSSRGAERGPSRGSDRGPSRGFDRGPQRDDDRAPQRRTPGPGRPPERDGERTPDRRPTRGPGGPDRSTDRGARRPSTSRAPDRDGERGQSRPPSSTGRGSDRPGGDRPPRRPSGPGGSGRPPRGPRNRSS